MDQGLIMQPNSGEQLALFSPGVLDGSGYGAWSAGFSAAPIVFPEVQGLKTTRGKRKERKGWKDGGAPMDHQFEEEPYPLDAAGLNWTEEGEGWKDMKAPESSKSKHRKDKKDDSSDGDRKGGAAQRKRKRKEMETAVPWTEEMVQYLFETYDDVHRRLYIESRGKVKNQKKWDPIIKTMQERFGREFTKNQCESKYWKVRRECTKYKLRLEKRAQQHESDAAYPGKAVRELLKPKFYDVWLQVAGDNSSRMPEIEVSSGSEDDMPGPDSHPGAAPPPGPADGDGDGDGDQQQHRHSSSCAIVREMQQLITVRLEASEKREEALNIRAELTMELLRQHMERMERTGLSGDDARQRQLQMIEGVDNKLDRLVNGLGTLNNNIGAIIGRLTSIQR